METLTSKDVLCVFWRLNFLTKFCFQLELGKMNNRSAEASSQLCSSFGQFSLICKRPTKALIGFFYEWWTLMQDHEWQESWVLFWGERKKHFGSLKCSNKNSRIYVFLNLAKIFLKGLRKMIVLGEMSLNRVLILFRGGYYNWSWTFRKVVLFIKYSKYYE